MQCAELSRADCELKGNQTKEASQALDIYIIQYAKSAVE